MILARLRSHPMRLRLREQQPIIAQIRSVSLKPHLSDLINELKKMKLNLMDFYDLWLVECRTNKTSQYKRSEYLLK